MTSTTSSPSAVIAVAEPVFTSAGHLAPAGFLAGYTGLTREAAATGSPDALEPAWCTLVVIGRQVGEGTAKHRCVLRGAASPLPASLALP